MKKFKGRGGPWHYDDELSGVYSESCRFVCDVTDKDNGILIAAAPELLEALQELISGYEDREQSGMFDMLVHGDLIEKANAAINKALGE